MTLFPFADYWTFYCCFTLMILSLLALDLGVFNRRAHVVGTKEALAWCVVWIGLAVMFGGGLYYYALHKFTTNPTYTSLPNFVPAVEAWRITLEYFTGFIVEKSLAVDNLFVFAVLFRYFAIPSKFQHRVLFYGILGALFFRVLFIAAGSVLMTYHAVVYFFGALLLLTGVKILLAPDKQMDPEKNPILRFLKRVLPISTREFDGKFIVYEHGVRMVTPLFVALIFIEISDIVFAIDSVPAIFAITKEPLIVFTSNIFAILGLRSMYFLLADMMHRFIYLKYALGIVLMFVGLKMVWLNDAFGGKFPISWSLGIILSLLTTSIVASLMRPKVSLARKASPKLDSSDGRHPEECTHTI